MIFTKDAVNELRAEINDVLRSVGAKYGIVIEVGRASYTATQVDFKLKLYDRKANWAASIVDTGLLEDDLDKYISLGGTRLKIDGFDPGARSNKVLLTDNKGKHYAAPVHHVKKALEAEYRPGNDASDSTLQDERKISDFELKATLCGLKGKVKYMQTFTFSGKVYKIIDLNPRAPKYPVIAEDGRGTQYSFTKEVINVE